MIKFLRSKTSALKSAKPTGASGRRGRLRSFVLALSLVCLTFTSALAHVWEIRVNQNQNGTLTFYMQSYHGLNECGHQSSGIRINGVDYPLQAEFNGSIAPLSNNIFTTIGSFARGSYATVTTPYIAGTLNVTAYSNNACWDGYPGMPLGNQSFTPPPPPVCTTAPITGWSNTVALPGNNNGTFCDANDDFATASIKVNHLACASITGDKQFRVIYDPAGANVSYGPFNYAVGIETTVSINIPAGATNATQVKVLDDDFPAQITHGLSIPNGAYLGEKETVAPTLTVPSNITANNDAATCGAKVSFAVTASDNCGNATVSQTAGLSSGSIFPVGTTVNTFKATDAAGNSTTASFTVTVGDTQAPIPTTASTGSISIQIPPGQTYNWNNYVHNFADPLPAGAVVTGITLSYSGRDQGWGGTGDWNGIHISGTHIGGNQFLHHTQSYVLNYNGAIPNYVYGGSNAFVMNFTGYPGWVGYFYGGTMTIRYNDNSALPTLTAECSATVTAPTANDNCEGIVTGTTSDATTYTAQGSNVITWSYTDSKGNISTQKQKVVIKDVTAPVVPVLADVTGECSATASVPTTTDNCSGTITGTTTDALTYTTQGTHVITWSFNDGNGNVSTTTQNVVVKDITAPVAPVLANVVGECSATVSVPTTTDNCAGEITGTTSDPLTYTAQGSYVVTWNFNDGNGNVTTIAQNVIVKDVTAPVAPVIANVVEECSATVTAPTATDNCAGEITGTTTDPLTYTAQGSYVVTWSFNDGNGNVTTATQNVVVKDLTAPTVLTKNVTVTLANATASITAASIDNGSFDACGIKSLSIDKSSFDCSEVGNHTITLTVVDNNGNVSTGTATVTVIGATPVVAINASRNDNTFTGLDNKTIALGYGAQALTLTATNSTMGATTYAWSPATGLSSTSVANPVFTPSAAGSYTFNVVATNEFGCTSSASITITVVDVRCGNKNDKVLVCQKTGSAKNPYVQICIAPSAVNAHLVKGSSLGTCGSSTSAIAAVQSSELSLGGNLTVSQSSSLTVYPNPIVGQSTVTFTLAADEANVSLDFYDLRGVRIKNIYTGKAEALKEYSFSFDGSVVPVGTYFFRVSGSKAALNFKVLVTQ
jgi:hypothetical protein